MKIRIAITLLFALSGQAHASSLKHAPKTLRDALKTAAKRPAGAKASRVVPKKGECTDFSGTWRGTCNKGIDESDSEDIVIGQDGCKEVDLGGLTMKFGGMVTLGETNPEDMITNLTAMPEWGTSLTTFKLHVNLAGRSLAEEQFLFIRGTNEYSMLEDKLITRSQYETRMIYAGNTYDGNYSDECIYEKVAK